jgi:hypothetical protein
MIPDPSLAFLVAVAPALRLSESDISNSSPFGTCGYVDHAGTAATPLVWSIAWSMTYVN